MQHAQTSLAIPKVPQKNTEVIFTENALMARARSNGRAFAWHVDWPGQPGSLLERMDYLTTIFPFDLVDIRESEPGSGADGHWKILLIYKGTESAKARMSNNFFDLILPRRKELAV